MSNEKDILEKHLESFNDVFADMINVLIYGGKETINENDLEDINPKSYYIEDEQIREQERDISKKWKKNNIILSFLGIENQTNIDPKMPFRVIGYEGVSYKYMLANKIPPCPVVTIVLNFSMTRWEKHKTLLEEMTFDEELKPFINDYKINVIDVAYLSRETVNKFKSDFKIIADYFVQMRETGEYKPMTDKAQHTWELLLLMSTLTDDSRFEVEYYREHREERADMCDVLDKVEAKGKHTQAVQGAIRMIKSGKFTSEEISEYQDLPLEEVIALSNQIKTVPV